MINESWVEKFRPKKLNEIISQKEIISSLEKTLETKNIPHLLFFGPSGCGKTSTILALAKELFTEKFWEDRVIELNASDERGIKVVREKIKRYAKNSVINNSEIPPWKIIILDEADNMTEDSQFALRKIMEDYSKVTRFCIICNYHNKIIDPIVSRCSLFRFKPIPKEEIKTRLKEICKNESMYCSDKNINKIIDISRGDMRKAVSMLQKCKFNIGLVSSKKKIKQYDNINEELIDEISGIVKKEYMEDIINYSIAGDVVNLDKILNTIHINSYSITNMLEPFSKLIIMSELFTDSEKSQIVQHIISIDQNLLKGCDEFIQLYRLAYYIMMIKN
jgi:replication factor C subunit 2/4